MAEMYVQGVSTRKVKNILEKMCGLEVSSAQVSDAAKSLDEEIRLFKERPLGCYSVLYVDAEYQRVRMNGSVVDAAVLQQAGGEDGHARSDPILDGNKEALQVRRVAGDNAEESMTYFDFNEGCYRKGDGIIRFLRMNLQKRTCLIHSGPLCPSEHHSQTKVFSELPYHKTGIPPIFHSIFHHI